MSLLKEPLAELFTRSRLLILDFSQIPKNTPADESIEQYFKDCEERNVNPRKPAFRQAFNDFLLAKTRQRYLISRYGEDRSSMLHGSEIAKQKRTIHLGIDIFCRGLETVYAPCDREIVRTGNEPENHSFGYFLIIKPDDLELPYIFLGHLAPGMVKNGHVKAGQQIATLGSYDNHENGGWSRHLHLQMLHSLPAKGVPVGYAALSDFASLQTNIPNPLDYFPGWSMDGPNTND